MTRRALVTGAGREGGIGQAIVARLEADGMEVVTLDREPGAGGCPKHMVHGPCGGVGELVEFAEGDAPVEVPDDVPVGIAPHRGGEHLQRVGEFRRDLGRLARGVAGQPRLAAVGAHAQLLSG